MVVLVLVVWENLTKTSMEQERVASKFQAIKSKPTTSLERCKILKHSLDKQNFTITPCLLKRPMEPKAVLMVWLVNRPLVRSERAMRRLLQEEHAVTS